jgi:hypothetical protein
MSFEDRAYLREVHLKRDDVEDFGIFLRGKPANGSNSLGWARIASGLAGLVWD